MKTWFRHAYAFIPIPRRGFSPLSEGGFGGVDRLVRTRASDQEPEELKITAVVDADPPLTPPPKGGEIWPQRCNKTIAGQAVRLARSRPSFHQPSPSGANPILSLSSNRDLIPGLFLTVAADSTPPIIDQRTMGENLLITCQRTVGGRGAVNSPKPGRRRPSSDPPGGAGAGNRVIHKFSPSAQWTLYSVKLFGIIGLFERCRGCPRRRARSTMNAVIR